MVRPRYSPADSWRLVATDRCPPIGPNVVGDRLRVDGLRPSPEESSYVTLSPVARRDPTLVPRSRILRVVQVSDRSIGSADLPTCLPEVGRSTRSPSKPASLFQREKCGPRANWFADEHAMKIAVLSLK